MAYTITEDCTSCGLCVDTCPVNAIIPDEPIYVIDPITCSDYAQCVAVCDDDAIIPESDTEEKKKKQEELRKWLRR